MIVDGRGIAHTIFRELRNMLTHMESRPHLTVFTCAPNFETQKYLSLKKRKAEEIGVGITIIEFPEDVTMEDMKVSIEHACMQTDGIIVQLPLPEHIDTETVLHVIPTSYDVDAVQYSGEDTEVLPPVVGAIATIVNRHNVSFVDRNVVIVGKGRLVGAPAEIWCKRQGAMVTVITKDTLENEKVIKEADILILGAGSPGLIRPDMIKEGVSIFDAGTSEEGGLLKGDADPACAKKASLFTPVPGGIGPITVAILLQNLILLTHKK